LKWAFLVEDDDDEEEEEEEEEVDVDDSDGGGVPEGNRSRLIFPFKEERRW